MKVTLTAVQRFDKDRNGNPLVSSKGRPYTRCIIKAQEYGDKPISGFGNSDNAKWNVGMVVEVDITQKGEYLNFASPRKVAPASPELIDKLNKIEALITDLSNALLGGKTTPVAAKTAPIVQAYSPMPKDVDQDSIPF